MLMQPLFIRFGLSLLERSLGRVLSDRGEWKEARDYLESAAERVEALWRKDPRLGSARPILGMVSMLPSKALARLTRRRVYLFAGGLGSLFAAFMGVFAFAMLFGRMA